LRLCHPAARRRRGYRCAEAESVQQCPPSDISARDDVCILQSLGSALHETGLLPMLLRFGAASRKIERRSGAS